MPSTLPPTGPGRPREFDEQQVVDRAMELFWHEGYGRASLPRILERTGIARGTLYRTFGDKRGLFLRAFERYGQVAVEVLDQTLKEASSPLAGVRAVLEQWRQNARSADYAGCLLFNSVGEFSGSEESELRRVTLEALGGVEQSFQRALNAAVEAGELPPAFDVEAMVHALLGVASAVVTLGRPDARPDAVDGILDTALRALAA